MNRSAPYADIGEVLDYYREIIEATAIYPEAGQGTQTAFAYVALGLSGESSEALEKSGDPRLADRGGAVFEDFRSELGDILWYIAALHREIDEPMSATWARVLAGAGGSPSPRPVEAMCIAAGRVAEIVKKAIRDAGGAVDAARRVQLVAALASCSAQWIAVHESLSIDLRDTIEANGRKLLSRKDRAVLVGDGDRR